jgi:hypothetical protein
VADFQHALIFQGPQGSSWSEIYYRGGGVIAAEPPIWMNGLVDARLSLLHSSVVLLRVVVHQLTSPKQTFQGFIGQVGTSKQTGKPSGPSDAAVIQLYGEMGGRRKMWMRGIPADTISLNQNGIGVAVNGKFTANFSSYIGLLASYGFGIRWLNQLPADGSGKWRISVADGTAVPGQALLTLDRALGATIPPPSTRVIIGGASKKDLPGMNGHYQVLQCNSAGPPVVAANQILIPYATPGNVKVLGGKASLRIESYQNISKFNVPLCKIVYPGEHTTKASFTSSRGASRANRIRQSP